MQNHKDHHPKKTVLVLTLTHKKMSTWMSNDWRQPCMFLSTFTMVKKPFEVFLSIFVICCQEFCKKHSRRDKDNHFSKPFEFPKTGHTHTEKTLILGDRKLEHYKKLGLKASIIFQALFQQIRYFVVIS